MTALPATPIDLGHLSAAPRCILSVGASLGEGPRWHDGEQRLYWVDIDACTLSRWHAASGAIETRRFDAPVACFGFRTNGGLVLGMKDGAALIDDWAGAPRPFGEQMLTGKPSHRLNDGRIDSMGRFWVGSVNGAKDAADAALYRIDRDGAVAEIAGGMMTCNAASFSADGARFVHADSPSHRLRLYDVDANAGTISNERTLHQFTPGVGPGLGRPDGGSFDGEGCYWSALIDGWRVVRISPSGDVLAEVALPVQRPTMIAFGGPDRCTAFVTTARVGLDDAALAAQPLAGGIFAFRVDVPGVAEWPAAM